jgi:hypothetical protein
MSKELVKAMLANIGQPAALSDGGILAANFREMLLTLKVDEPKWDELMDKFVRQEMQLVEQSNDSIYDTMRANLTKELTAAQFSWKTYLNGMRFLGFTGVKFVTSGSINGVDVVTVSTPINWTGPKAPAPEAPKAPEAPEAPAAEGQSE